MKGIARGGEKRKQRASGGPIALTVCATPYALSTKPIVYSLEQNPVRAYYGCMRHNLQNCTATVKSFLEYVNQKII